MRTITESLVRVFSEIANLPDAYFSRDKMVGAPWLTGARDNLYNFQPVPLHNVPRKGRFDFMVAAQKTRESHKELMCRVKSDIVAAHRGGAVMSLPAKARYFAAAVHAFEADKSGEPYITHPWRVALAIADKGGTQKQQALAYVHDTIEHGHCTLEDYAAMAFPTDFLTSLDALTRRKGEPYIDYCQRLSMDHDAVIVKLADGDDNSKNRKYVFPWKRSASFTLKKRLAYPVTQQYLRDVAAGKAQGGISIAQWMRGSEDLPPRLRDPAPLIAAGLLSACPA